MSRYTFNKKEHVHTLDEKPLVGTSSVIDVISKPLTYWASGMAVGYLGWKNVKLFPLEECHQSAFDALQMIKDLDEVEYYKLLCDAYKAHSVKLESSADAGTDMHAILEKYVKESILSGTIEIYGGLGEDKKALATFSLWANLNVKRFLWSEMHVYSEKHWLGGISDVGVELKNGDYAIIDFKSSKEAYPSQFLQVGGYNLQIEENGGFTPKGEKIFILDKPIKQHIIFPFGAKNPEPQIRYNVEEAKQAFINALHLRKYLESIK